MDKKLKYDIGLIIPLKEEFRVLITLCPIVNSFEIDAIQYHEIEIFDSQYSAIAVLLDNMGPTTASQVTEKVLSSIDLKILFLIGIAGSLDDDVKIGDVVVANEVNEFQATSKAVSKEKSFEYKYSGNHWDISFPLINYVNNFEFSSKALFKTWKNTAKEMGVNLEIKTDKLIREYPDCLIGHIASGDTVCASENFKITLKGIDRKFLAIEMEAGGFIRAVRSRRNPIEALIIRGISDFSDDRKNSIESLSKGKLRKYAMYNALNLFLCLIKSKIFHDLITPNAIKDDSEVDRDFDAELTYSKDLMVNFKISSALEFLVWLRNRIWDRMVNSAKFKILNQIAVCNWLLEDRGTAATNFFESAKYTSDDEKALINKAFGNLILNKTHIALKIAQDLIKTNPANFRAYKVQIEATPCSQTLDEVLVKIPDAIKANSEVSFSISHFARKKEDPSQKKWVEISVQNDKDDSPFYSAELGKLIINEYLKQESKMIGKQITSVDRQEILKAISLITNSWDKISVDHKFKIINVEWLFYRGWGYLILDNREKAKEDLELAIKIDSKDPVIARNLSSLALSLKEFKIAKRLLESIISKTEIKDTPLLLSEILRLESKHEEAVNEIEKFIDNQEDVKYKEEGIRLLLQIYTDDLRDISEAQKIVSKFEEEDKSDRFIELYKIKLYRLNNDEKSAREILVHLKQELVNCGSFREKVQFVREYFILDMYDEGIEILENTIDPNLNNPLTYQLIEALNKSGQIKRTLELSLSLRKLYGPEKFITEIEMSILEEIGDLNSAKSICLEYLNKFPEEIFAKIRLASINYRLGNITELENFLKSIDHPRKLVNRLSINQTFYFSLLFSLRGMEKKSFELIYELRRKYSNDAEIHYHYITHIFLRERDNQEWMKLGLVGIDSAIYTKDQHGKKEWFIIEDREDNELRTNELSLVSPLSKKLIGKKIGDKIILSHDEFSEDFIEIKDIKSKYLHALHESMYLYPKLLPEKKKLWLLSLNISSNDKELEESLQEFFKHFKKRNRFLKKFEKLYIEGKITLGSFASITNENIIRVWASFVNTPEIGVRCAYSSTTEFENASALLANQQKILILDFIALLSIFSLEIESIINKRFKNFAITQSTIELIRFYLYELKGIKSKGYITIGFEKDKFIRQEITAEDIGKQITFLKGVVTWINLNCKILPCKKALELKREDKQNYDSILGKSFIDSILLAKEREGFLYSDDVFLRNIAKKEFQVDGIWTQLILLDCLKENILTQSEYNTVLMKLIQFNYKVTKLDSDFLIKAAKDSKWLPILNYAIISKNLLKNYPDEVQMYLLIANFTIKLWKQNVSLLHKEALIYYLFFNLTEKKHPYLVKRKIIETVEILLRNYKMLDHEIYIFITWLKETLEFSRKI